jgi:hypothetical protein
MPTRIQQALSQFGQPLRREFPDADEGGAQPSGPVDGQCDNELGTSAQGLQNHLACELSARFAPTSPWSFLGAVGVDRDPGRGDTFQYAAGVGYAGPKLTSQFQAGVFALPLTWNQPRSPVIDWNTQYKIDSATEAHVGIAAATDGGATELNVGASRHLFKSDAVDVLASAEYQHVGGREDVPLGSSNRVLATLTPTFQLNPKLSLELNARLNAGVGTQGAQTVGQGGAKVTYSATQRLDLSVSVNNMGGPIDVPGDPARAHHPGVGLGASYEFDNGMKLGLETLATSDDQQALLTLTVPFGDPKPKR